MRRCALAWRLAAALFFVASPAFAIDPESFAEPAQEARYRALLDDLRCMMCQNQTLADSSAPLARDMRRLVRERMLAGDGDDEIKNRLAARYGDFILYRPPLAAKTWLLWFGPALLLALAIAIWIRKRLRANGEGDDDGLSPAQKQRAADLLREESQP